MLNINQQQKALKVWEEYLKSDKTFKNANDVISQDEIDKQRIETIPTAQTHINKYFSGELKLEVFKTEIDGLNKKNRLWGFQGVNGQMYFNMLYNSSYNTGKLDELDSTLKKALKSPSDIDVAKRNISLLADFSDSLRNYVADKRTAPRTGSVDFFISYFWQVQDHLKWPIFYKSMVDAFQALDIWTLSWDYPKDYEDFYELNNVLINLFSKKQENITYWDVEHAFWLWAEEVDDTGSTIVSPAQPDKIKTLPNSFIPPVVSIIPQLANNDEELEKLCKEIGLNLPTVFEERISVLYRMLGYEVESLGQGHGRVHDGTAKCAEYQYAILFDAKARENGYKLSTDDRAIKEYILKANDDLKKQGIRNIYFAVISSYFNEDLSDFIRSLKMEVDVKEFREIIFLEASALLTMLSEKLRNPQLDLGPKGLQQLYANSGVLTNSHVKEFLGI
ncbi:hypothetical protein ACFLSS_03765 [Bacteroidota bacterium]